MKHVIYIAGIMAFVVSACGSNSTEDKTKQTDNTAPVSITVPGDKTTPVNNNTPVTLTPNSTPVVNPVTNTTVVQPAVSKAGLNPAHGQPGHRCDIAVGAPLDSKPAQTATTTSLPLTNSQSSPVVIGQPETKPAASTTPSAGAKGLNPAHGQPGHRCDIAVGAPLDSKPTVINATSAPATPTSNSIPNKVPVINSTATGSSTTTINTTPATAVAPGMNPSHGQPGHRCDIAVGAPLPKQ